MYGFFDKYNALFVHLSQQESYHIFVQKLLNIDSNIKFAFPIPSLFTSYKTQAEP